MLRGLVDGGGPVKGAPCVDVDAGSDEGQCCGDIALARREVESRGPVQGVSWVGAVCQKKLHQLVVALLQNGCGIQASNAIS